FKVDLAEGRDTDGRQTLIVRHSGEGLTPQAVDAIVDRARDDGYDAIAFGADNPLGQQIAERVGGKLQHKAVDVLFGDSEDLASVELPARPSVAQVQPQSVANEPPVGWGAIESSDQPLASMVMTKKMTNSEINATFSQMTKV